MRDLMLHLRDSRQCLAAQVHSHPGRAFHSLYDDHQAVVRHEGALSIVVPRFGKCVTVHNLQRLCAFYRLTHDDAWVRIGREHIPKHLDVATE